MPKEETKQVVDVLLKSGRVVEVRYYPNESHGFAKRKNQMDALQRQVAWFARYLDTSK